MTTPFLESNNAPPKLTLVPKILPNVPLAVSQGTDFIEPPVLYPNDKEYPDPA